MDNGDDLGLEDQDEETNVVKETNVKKLKKYFDSLNN